MENLLVKCIITIKLRILKSNLLVREEHEVIDKNLGCFLQCILRVNGTVRCHFNDKLVVVSLLFYTIRLYIVANITDRGIDRIDWKYIDISAELSVLFSRHIATTFIDCQVNLH